MRMSLGSQQETMNLPLALAGAVLLLSACRGSPEPNDTQLAGSTYELRGYVTADSSHYQLSELCVNLADPRNANSTSLGSASLEFAETMVREQQFRLVHFACSGSLNGDTAYVDQEREYAIDGNRVRIRRPRSAGGWYEDTGHVYHDTLDMTVHQCSNDPCATVLWRYVMRP